MDPSSRGAYHAPLDAPSVLTPAIAMYVIILSRAWSTGMVNVCRWSKASALSQRKARLLTQMTLVNVPRNPPNYQNAKKAALMDNHVSNAKAGMFPSEESATRVVEVGSSIYLINASNAVRSVATAVERLRTAHHALLRTPGKNN